MKPSFTLEEIPKMLSSGLVGWREMIMVTEEVIKLKEEIKKLKKKTKKVTEDE